METKKGILSIHDKEATTPIDALMALAHLPIERLAEKGWELSIKFRVARYTTKPEDHEELPEEVLKEIEQQEKVIHLREAAREMVAKDYADWCITHPPKSVRLSYSNRDGVLKLEPGIVASLLEKDLQAHELFMHTDRDMDEPDNWKECIHVFDRQGLYNHISEKGRFSITDYPAYNSRINDLTFSDLLEQKTMPLVDLLRDCTDVPQEELRRFGEVGIHSDATVVDIKYDITGKNRYGQASKFMQLVNDDLYLTRLIQGLGFDQASKNGSMVCTVDAYSPDNGKKGSLMSITTSYGFQVFPTLAHEHYLSSNRRVWTVGAMTQEEAEKFIEAMTPQEFVYAEKGGK